MSRENANILENSSDFGEIFELVKKAANETLGMHRAGLTLVMGDLPNDIGAYHQMGSNAIVMNRNLVKIVWRLSRSSSMRNSYAFMVLLHEYLHSLGFADDAQVRDLSRKVITQFLGEKHIAGEMAVQSLDKFFPDMHRYAAFRDKGSYETVTRFDSSSTSYIA